MAVLIDPPRWPAHGRLWSHLASDTSLDELHAFAALTGIPRRGFEGDHYDIPAERYRQAVAAGAQEVEGRELLRRLVAAGLRVPKRRGEKVVTSHRATGDRLLGPRVVDVVASALAAPGDGVLGSWVLVTAAGGADAGSAVLLVRGTDGWDLPGGLRTDGEPVEGTVQAALSSAGVPAGGGRPVPAGYLRIRPVEPSGDGSRARWSFHALLRLRLEGALERASGEVRWWPPDDAVDVLAARPLGPLVRYLVAGRATGTVSAHEDAR